MAERGELTTRQREIYNEILRCYTTYGLPPSVREIGEFMGINSPNGVMCHLSALRKKGWLISDTQGRSRSIIPIDMLAHIQQFPKKLFA